MEKLKKTTSNLINFIGKGYIALAVIIIVGSFTLKFFLVSEQWAKDARPYTDSFLTLLQKAEYQKLYNKFASTGVISFQEFNTKAQKINDVFGQIDSFDYERSYYSTEGKEKNITGFYIVYNISFDNGKTEKGYFTLMIDKQKNCPITDKIKSFSVEGNVEKGEFFSLHLTEQVGK